MDDGIDSKERLYFVRAGVYVQYSGEGACPEEIAEYQRRHGEMPPFIPLPTRVTYFELGSDSIKWPGSGPLPAEVLTYVCENGVLPRNGVSSRAGGPPQTTQEHSVLLEDEW